MAHHTRLVQGRLPIENKDIPVLQMAVYLLVHGSLGKERPRGATARTLRDREKRAGNRLPLIPTEFILQKFVGDLLTDRTCVLTSD